MRSQETYENGCEQSLKTDGKLVGFQAQGPSVGRMGGGGAYFVALLRQICTYSVCMDGRFVRAVDTHAHRGRTIRQINTLSHVL
jgi:hypothetical protein